MSEELKALSHYRYMIIHLDRGDVRIGFSDDLDYWNAPYSAIDLSEAMANPAAARKMLTVPGCDIELSKAQRREAIQGDTQTAEWRSLGPWGAQPPVT